MTVTEHAASHRRTQHTPAHLPHQDAADRNTGVTIALAVLGVFVTYVPITAISVALTTIAGVTQASTSDLQWVSDGFVIPMAAAVLSAGLFGDLFGRRRVFLVGMALTTVGAVIAGLASTLTNSSAIHLLWTGQAVSGLGAGMLLPTTLALIGQAVPDFRRGGKFIGIWATGLMLGLAVGPISSGLILDHTSWGWTFAPTAALALIAAVVALVKLPESKAPEGRKLDWPGQFLATVAIVGSIYGTIKGGESGWTATTSLVAYAAAASALIAFIVVELRTAAPLIQLRLFGSPTFSAAGLAAMIALFSIVGSMFLLSLFLGYVQHLSPLQIGFRLLFVTGVGAVVNPLIGTVVLPRVNAMLLLGGGVLLAAVGILLLTGLENDTSFGDLAWRLSVFGVAVAVMLTAVSTAAINAVPWKLAGMAAAANTALRQYGGALGPAVLGVIYTDRISGGASAASAVHTAMVVNAVLLGLAAIACLAAARHPADKAA
jgi:EmrB/QacA subfamily drug resistance transporter